MSGYEVKARDKPCPSCERLIPAEAVVCTRCGLNLKTGVRFREAPRDPADAERKAAALKQARKAGDLDAVSRIEQKTVREPSLCGNCGYDLAGLLGKTCPECGQTAEERSKGRAFGTHDQRRQVEIDRYWRTTLLVCTIGGGAGLLGTLAVGLGLHRVDTTACLVHFVICEAALFAGYFGICFFFLGFEEDVRGLALRLAGVASVWSALLTLTSLLGLGGMYGVIIGACVSVVALSAPLHVLTDRDWNDSNWIAAVSWFIYIVATIAASLIL
jgi:hypothetical protein